MLVVAMCGLSGCNGDADPADPAPDMGAEGEGEGEGEGPAIEWVSIAAGTFTMGVEGGGDNPAHDVTLSAFEISATEVTNRQYLVFLEAAMAAGQIYVEAAQRMGPGGMTNDLYAFGAEGTPYAGMEFIQFSESGGTTSGGEPESDLNRCWITWDGIAFYLADDDKGDWPATWIKWHGAAAFAEFYGWRLPTEAEWEYAASAGGTLTYATSTGEIDDTLVNYNGDQPGVHDAEGHVEAVKSYPANPWGLYEMSGNAWEWCQDWYADDYYTTSPDTDPLNLEGEDIPASLDSSKRIRRGGSWNYHTATMAAAARASDYPFRGNNHFGLRVAR